MQPAELKKLIRQVPDFPKPGIEFYDVCTLFRDAGGLRAAIQGMVAQLDAGGYEYPPVIAVLPVRHASIHAFRPPHRDPFKRIEVP